MLRESAVVLPRGEVQYVVTEYGSVNLFGKSIQERAIALISIAVGAFAGLAQKRPFVLVPVHAAAKRRKPQNVCAAVFSVGLLHLLSGQGNLQVVGVGQDAYAGLRGGLRTLHRLHHGQRRERPRRRPRRLVQHAVDTHLGTRRSGRRPGTLLRGDRRRESAERENGEPSSRGVKRRVLAVRVLDGMKTRQCRFGRPRRGVADAPGSQ